MQLFQQSEATAAQRRLFFHAVDATDGISAETGLTGTGRLSKNGAATAATTANIVEVDNTNMPGRYYIEFTQAELDTVGVIEFRFKTAACAEVVARAQVVPWDPYDAVRLGATALPNAAAAANGGLPTVDAANAVKVQSGTGANQISLSSGLVTLAGVTHTGATIPAVTTTTTATNVTTVNSLAANVVTAAALAADAVDKILDEVVEGTITLRQAIRLLLSAATAICSGGGTATITFRDIGDTKDRIVVTVDANGNRTAVGTRDGT